MFQFSSIRNNAAMTQPFGEPCPHFVGHIIRSGILGPFKSFFFFFKVFRVDINNANVFWALLIQEEKQPTSGPPATPQLLLQRVCFPG